MRELTIIKIKGKGLLQKETRKTRKVAAQTTTTVATSHVGILSIKSSALFMLFVAADSFK